MQVHVLAEAATLDHTASAATPYLLPVNSGWEEVSVFVNLEVGAGSEAVTFSAEGRLDDDGTWCALPLHDLSAAQDEDIQAASKQLTADTNKALFQIKVWAPRSASMCATRGRTMPR